MKAWKNAVAILMAALMLLGVVGCAQTEPDSPAVSEPTSTESESESTAGTQGQGTSGSQTPTPTPTPSQPAEDGTLKILAIGNSFSVDGMEYLWDICKAGGVDVKLGNLYIGGCTLDTHWSNISLAKNVYRYYTNKTGTWLTNENVSVQTALADEDWDIITVQQASGSSGKSDTYGSLNNIVTWLEANKTNRDARILWHMTWAYAGSSNHAEFPKYNSNQMTMYTAITGVTQSTVLPNSRIDGVIPSGTAIQNLRSSYIGDTVTRDGYHLSYGLGRYTAGLTWYATLTGRSVDAIEWVPPAHAALSLDLDVIKESVKNAIQTPYEVTTSTRTVKPTPADADILRSLGLDPAAYEQLALGMTLHAYYNSPRTYGLTTGDNTAPKYSASLRFTKAELPVGAVILVDAGYQYRPEGWTAPNTLTPSRPGVVTESVVKVSEAWWGGYTERAFNLSYVGASAQMTAADHSHLRIYVPKA